MILMYWFQLLVHLTQELISYRIYFIIYLLIIIWLKDSFSFVFASKTSYDSISPSCNFLPIRVLHLQKTFHPSVPTKLSSNPNHMYLKVHFEGYLFNSCFLILCFRINYQVLPFLKGNCRSLPPDQKHLNVKNMPHLPLCLLFKTYLSLPLSAALTCEVFSSPAPHPPSLPSILLILRPCKWRP